METVTIKDLYEGLEKIGKSHLVKDLHTNKMIFEDESSVVLEQVPIAVRIREFYEKSVPNRGDWVLSADVQGFLRNLAVELKKDCVYQVSLGAVQKQLGIVSTSNEFGRVHVRVGQEEWRRVQAEKKSRRKPKLAPIDVEPLL